MPTATPTAWRGLPAWRVANGCIEVVVTATGAALACIRHVGEELNPLWQPRWPSAAQPDPTVHGDPLGEGRLLAVAAGSLLCLDRFGPPRPGEDRPFHGEAATAPWSLIETTEDQAIFATTLMQAGLAVQRCFRLADETCTVTTTATSRDGRDHDVEWCEHATLGDPFLDGAVIAAGIDLLDPAPGTGQSPLTGEATAALLAMPRAADPPRGDLWSGRVAAGWWRAEHPGLRRRLTATWAADDFPWLVLWTEHRARSGIPWLGRERARGLELSTKPFPTPGAHPAEFHHGRPTRCRVPADRPLTKTVSFTWSTLP